MDIVSSRLFAYVVATYRLVYTSGSHSDPLLYLRLKFSIHVSPVSTRVGRTAFSLLSCTSTSTNLVVSILLPYRIYRIWLGRLLDTDFYIRARHTVR